MVFSINNEVFMKTTSLRFRFTIFPILFFLFTPYAALAAESAYILLLTNDSDVEGPDQSPLGELGVFKILELKHTISMNSDTKQHGHIKILKNLHPTSILLYKAFDRREDVTATITFYDKDPVTKDTRRHYTIELRNARIEGITTTTTSTDKAGIVAQELVSISYHTITWTGAGGFEHVATNNVNPP